MALQPSLRPLIIAGSHDAPHTLDVFRKYYYTKWRSQVKVTSLA